MPSKEAVDAFYNKALERGATDEGTPGQRIEGFYAGYYQWTATSAVASPSTRTLYRR